MDSGNGGQQTTGGHPLPVALAADARHMVPGARRSGRWYRADQGAAAVEMAIVLPLLLLVLFAVVDFGRMLNAQITLTQAAREGARAAVLNADPTARAQDAASGLAPVQVAVTPCPATSGAYDDAVVVTSHTFTFITPLGNAAALFGGDLDSSYQLTGRGVMPCLG